MIKSITVICAGASLGALLRYVLSITFNSVFPAIPLGTLLANLVGGYLIGVSLGVFSGMTSFDPKWQLFIITGFLGALTTFSSFSAEVVSLVMQNQLSNALCLICIHTLGSFGMTFFGIKTVSLLKGLFI